MNFITKFTKNPLIIGSGIIFTGSIAANFGHYIFNLAMGRLLTTSQYGLIASLVSVAVLFSVFQTSLTGIFAKFAAKFEAGHDAASLSDLVKTGFKIALVISSAILLVLIFSWGAFAGFLHVNNNLLIMLTYSFIFISIVFSLPVGVLQGQMKVYLISLINILTAVLKLFVGVGLVYLGFQVAGALFGIVFASVITYFLAMYYIRKNLRGKNDDRINEQKLLSGEIKDYGVKFFLASLGIAMFTSMDIILARHFFSPVLAGQYAALAVMGKAIFYITFPINFVFFPLIAQKREKKEKVLETLMLAAAITVLISILGSFVYFLFPNLVLRIFFPAPSYKMLAPYLGPFSLYVLIFSIVSLMNSYLLSIGKTQIYKINIFSGFLLTILIIFFHASLFQVIGILFTTSFLFLILILIFYYHNGRD